MKNNLMLFYVGGDRSASSILAKQKVSMSEKATSLMEMRNIAASMKDILERKKDLREFGELLHHSWQLKKSLSEQISSPALDEIYARAISNGALGGKLLGAGGGGFFLFFVEPKNQDKVSLALNNLRKIDFYFEPKGSKIIVVA